MSENAALRKVLGRFVTGVTVVTAVGASGPVGVTVNSFTAVSLDPALILFCLKASSDICSDFDTVSSFAVNILSERQEEISRRFARSARRWIEGIACKSVSTGAPVLTEALAYLDCDLEDRIEVGDHVIMLGRVRDFGAQRSELRPLTFYAGRYPSLSFSS